MKNIGISLKGAIKGKYINIKIKINEPVHEISNNMAYDMCRLGQASAASF